MIKKTAVWVLCFIWLGVFSLLGCQPLPQPIVTVTPSVTQQSDATATATPTLSEISSLPAFPGAEGFGSQTVGGRGGQVIEVTNLEDAGAGSLRAALETDGPRIVIFRLAGTIELQSTLVINKPYITIAGQTAPGAGITLRAVSPNVEALIRVETHDVVIRYLSLRAGPPSAGDALEVFASDAHDTYNVVIDHNSLSWAVNRNLATWYDVHEITIQWNLLSEGLNCSIHPKGCHSKGALLGGYASNENKDQPGASNISFHHNLMAHNGERNPYVEAAGLIDIVNNVAYNPFGTFSHVDMVDQLAPDLLNYVGNYFKPGPNTEVKFSIRAINPGAPGAKIFVQGNIGPQRQNDNDLDVEVVDPDSRQFIVPDPFPAASITTTSASTAYEQVLADAGANKGLSCDGTFFTRRDAIDQRIVDEVKNGTGKIINDPSEVGGWLGIDPSAACPDLNHNGLPDTWEQKYRLNVNDPALASADIDGDGYTNIEEFLNGTDPNVKE